MLIHVRYSALSALDQGDVVAISRGARAPGRHGAHSGERLARHGAAAARRTAAAARAAAARRPADLDEGSRPGERLRLPLRRKRQFGLGARADSGARRGAADTPAESSKRAGPLFRVVGVRVVLRRVVGLVRRRLLRVLPVAARVQEAEYYVDGTDLTCVCLSRRYAFDARLVGKLRVGTS